MVCFLLLWGCVFFRNFARQYAEKGNHRHTIFNEFINYFKNKALWDL